MTDTVENIIGWPTAVPATPVSPQVSIYPNPANDALMISTGNTTYSALSVANTIGQQLISGPLTKINVTTLPPGMYYITLTGDAGITVQKFEKM